jgi:hypothetical protein
VGKLEKLKETNAVELKRQFCQNVWKLKMESRNHSGLKKEISISTLDCQS